MQYLWARLCFVLIRARAESVLQDPSAHGKAAEEYNVIRGLRKCFKINTAVITAFADNEVGMLMEDFICQGGVDTSLIKWMKTDGIGRICRNGLNFTERGFGIRGAVGCSDRANTAISKATPDDF